MKFGDKVTYPNSMSLTQTVKIPLNLRNLQHAWQHGLKEYTLQLKTEITEISPGTYTLPKTTVVSPVMLVDPASDLPQPPLPTPRNKLEEVGITADGYTIYREPNEVGGHCYWSDEIGGGVMVWSTSLVSPRTLEWCLNHEKLSNSDPTT